MAPGDFNNDGKLDVVVANDRDGTIDGSSTVSVLLGNGGGSFQAPRTFAVGSFSWAVAVGDFNADGAADLAAGNTASTTVSVLLGFGNGNFPAAFTIAVGHNPEGLAAADFNGDGKRDLAVSNAGTDSVSVMLGRGDGTFQQPTTFAAGQVPVFLAVGDFNRDSRQDLVVANYGSNTYYSDVVASTVSVLLGNGDGTFQAQRTFAAGSGPHGIAVGDFNRDGKPDLAVANLGPYPQRATTVAVLIGQGDGTFRAPQTFQAGRALTGVAIGDFNRDGLQDLTLSSGDDATVSVLLGNGNGTFQAVRSFGAGSSPKSVAVGDFNADQKPDLVVSDHFSDTVSVLIGNGNGTFLPRQIVDAGRNPAWVSAADLNGDGVQDLAVANWFATTVSVLAGKGDGTFHPGQDFGASAAPEKAILADFNGDGRLDIAVANYFAATVSVLINTTTPWSVDSIQRSISFLSLSVSFSLSSLPSCLSSSLVSTGNLDMTRKSAWLVLRVVATLLLPMWVASIPAQTLRFAAHKDYPSGFGPASIAVGDVNGDLRPDLAVANSFSDTVAVLLGNADGSFQPPSLVFVGPSNNPRSVAIADFNRDGRPDLAVANPTSNTVIGAARQR